MSSWQDIDVNGDVIGVDIVGSDAALFDDVVSSPTQSLAKIKNSAVAAKEVIAQAEKSSLPPPPMVAVGMDDEVVGYDGSVSHKDNFEVFGGLFGATSPEGSTPAVFTTRKLPLLKRLYNFFTEKKPAPRKVRVDTRDTYRNWRDVRRAPYLEELSDKMADLENAIAANGGFDEAFDDDHIDELRRQVSIAHYMSESGGEQIPLQLPPFARGKVHAWQDGEEILCSIILPGNDGRVRIASSGTSAPQHVDRVLGYAHDAGVDLDDVIGAVPALAQMLGGGQLVPQLAAASPSLLSRPEVIGGATFVGKMMSAEDCTYQAVVGLAEMAKRGDSRAQQEWAKLVAFAKTYIGKPVAKLLAKVHKGA